MGYWQPSVYIYWWVYIYTQFKKAFLNEAKIVNEVWSLLLETQHNKWASTQRSKQGREAHQERKGVGVSDSEEEPPPIFLIVFWVFGHLWCFMCFPGGSEVKNPSARQRTHVLSLDQEDPLEKEMAIHSSILAWRIPWMEELGRLPYMGL